MPKIRIGKVVGASGQSVEPRGVYDNSVTYNKRDLVTYNNSSYIALKETTGNLPINTMFWQMSAEGIGNTAADIEYDNSKSELKSTNIQLAIDELNGLVKENSSSVPEGVTYVPSEEGSETETVNPIPVDADTLEGHSADYFAPKADIPEAFDYRIPAGKSLQFDGVTPFTAQNNGSLLLKAGSNNSIQLNANGTIKLLKALLITSSSVLNFLNQSDATNAQIYLDSGETLILRKLINNSWNNIIQIKSDGVTNILRTILLNASVNVANGITKYFQDSDGKNVFAEYFSNNVLHMQAFNTSWSDIYNISQTNISFNKTATFLSSIRQNYNVFTNYIRAANTIAFRAGFNDVDYIFQYYGVSSWENAYSIDQNGNITFNKAIKAPNIPSTTALMEAEQEITEMDLQNISTQQQMTDLELQVLTLSEQVSQNNETIETIKTQTQEVTE